MGKTNVSICRARYFTSIYKQYYRGSGSPYLLAEGEVPGFQDVGCSRMSLQRLITQRKPIETSVLQERVSREGEEGGL